MSIHEALPDLAQFTGSEHWYRQMATPFTFTDGVKYVADNAGAYWLIDLILYEMQSKAEVRKEEFQVWKLDVASLTLTGEDGNGNVIGKHKLDFTDFPEPGIEFWFENNVLYLPSER